MILQAKIPQYWVFLRSRHGYTRSFGMSIAQSSRRTIMQRLFCSIQLLQGNTSAADAASGEIGLHCKFVLTEKVVERKYPTRSDPLLSGHFDLLKEHSNFQHLLCLVHFTSKGRRVCLHDSLRLMQLKKLLFYHFYTPPCWQVPVFI